jgi:diguanylate cyclase (GGDEF)-like protein
VVQQNSHIFTIDDNPRIGVFYLDLDRFKAIDDCFGNLTSDRILIDLVKRIQKCLSNNDVLARISIDEFAIKLDKIQNSEAALLLAKKLIKFFKNLFISAIQR